MIRLRRCDSVRRRGEIPVCCFLKHIPDIHDELPRPVRYRNPVPVSESELEPRAISGGQQGEEIDIFVGCSPKH